MKIEVASATFREATGFGSYASFATCCVFQGLYLAEGSYGFEDIMRRCSGGPCMLAAMHAVAPGPEPTFEPDVADDRLAADCRRSARTQRWTHKSAVSSGPDIR